MGTASLEHTGKCTGAEIVQLPFGNDSKYVCFDKVALLTEKILKFRNLGGCFTVTYSYKCYGREYKDKVRFYHSIQDYKELRDYFKERYHAEK